MLGWVYILNNAAMPGLVKIGFTVGDPLVRAKELSRGTGPESSPSRANVKGRR
ncbi:MAG: GIY-YIG nuclease family protein [Burkholderiaceae bacterium]